MVFLDRIVSAVVASIIYSWLTLPPSSSSFSSKPNITSPLISSPNYYSYYPLTIPFEIPSSFYFPLKSLNNNSSSPTFPVSMSYYYPSSSIFFFCFLPFSFFLACSSNSFYLARYSYYNTYSLSICFLLETYETCGNSSATKKRTRFFGSSYDISYF